MLSLGLHGTSCHGKLAPCSVHTHSHLQWHMHTTKQDQAQNKNGTAVKHRLVNCEKPIDLLDTHFVQHCAVLI